MSVDTHIIGFKPPDKKWKEMKTVYDACEKAGIAIPEDVKEFFDYEKPDKKGVQVNIFDAIEEWENDDGFASGYQVNLKKVPSDVKYIRFYYSA